MSYKKSYKHHIHELYDSSEGAQFENIYGLPRLVIGAYASAMPIWFGVMVTYEFEAVDSRQLYLCAS